METLEGLEIKKTIDETYVWIQSHLERSPTDYDMSWYVSLNVVYGDYLERMKRLRLRPLSKKEFCEFVFLELPYRARINERYFTTRSYDHKSKTFQDKKAPHWVIDGVRYYRDKIGGELVFGL